MVRGESENGLVLVSIHEDLLPGIRAVLPEFERRTGVPIAAQSVPYSAHELWIRTQMLSRKAPDVLLVESTDLPWRYGQAGLLAAWDEWLQSPNPHDAGHLARPWQEAFHNELIHQARDAAGTIWCVPYTQYGVGFFYNRGVYEELRLTSPQTWEELLANFGAVRADGRSALVTAVKPNDHQSLWMADMLLELLLRPVAEQVNLQTRAGWRYDPLDPECTRGEVITLEERLVAFDRGLIDPARAPAFRETARLMRRLAAEFRPDFLSLDGEEVPRVFARGESVHFLNGTWFLRPLTTMQRSIADIAPDRVFPWGVFPFPELTAETTALPRLGGINQNSGLRACFIVPRQPANPERERRAIDLVRFLTAPAVAEQAFGETAVYDLPAMTDVPPKPGAEPLVPKVRYAFLVLAQFRGYDARSEGEFWTLWQ
ncbi:MAG TPA: extracellular solute-binding protein, partial [Opitutus sp.]|nr:extracellular solute-binding protein [Opitutus sp.]